MESTNKDSSAAAPVDQTLLDEFKLDMARRRAGARNAATPAAQARPVAVVAAPRAVEHELVEDDGNFDTLIPVLSTEAPAGFGYNFDEPATKVGGYIPSIEHSYAYQKVLTIRAANVGRPTIEPTDFTLEEFERIHKYNIDLVEQKGEKKGGQK